MIQLKEIQKEEGKKNIGQAFNIIEERELELHKEMQVVLTQISDKIQKNEIVDGDAILRGFFDLAKTDDEQGFCIFQAGLKTEELASIIKDPIEVLKRILKI